MNVEFEKIEIQNFKSIGEKIELDYKALNGLNFIYGSNLDVPNAKNGAGKSALFTDALVFALFGKTLKNTTNKYIPNRSVESKLDMYVKLYLRSNGQLYSCKTGGKVSKSGATSLSMELLKLNDDYSVDEDLTQASMASTKEYIIDNILGCSFNVFKSSVVMTSSDFTNFYEGMTKEQKRKYVETIFNLDVFGEMATLVKADLNSSKHEVSSLKNELINASKRLDELKEKSAEHEAAQANRKSRLKAAIIEKLKALKKLQADFDEVSIDANEESKLAVKQKEIKMKRDEISTESAELKTKIAKCESTIAHNDRTVSQMKKILEKLCDKCEKKIKNVYNYDVYVDESAEAKKTIEQSSKRLAELKAQRDLIDKESVVIEEAVCEASSARSKREKLETSIGYAKIEIANLKDQFDAEMTQNPFSALIAKAKDEFDEDTQKLKNTVTNVKYLDIVKDAVSENGVKKYILTDIVKLLNSLIQKYLNEIGCEFIVYFDETFDFKFITITGECDFTSFSAGERQRIQIATLLAFRDLIINSKISSNIFIIDELLDANVDATCIENVMTILKRKAEESGQSIFMISHRSELAENTGFWNNIIKVIKENQQTRYEVI